MATTTGFVTEHRGWSDRLADRSIALVSQASDMAANYAEIADLVLGRSENDLVSPADAMIDVQNDVQDDIQNEVQARLACAQRTLVRRQADLVRLQATKSSGAGAGALPAHDRFACPELVIEIPQAPELPEYANHAGADVLICPAEQSPLFLSEQLS